MQNNKAHGEYLWQLPHGQNLSTLARNWTVSVVERHSSCQLNLSLRNLRADTCGGTMNPAPLVSISSQRGVKSISHNSLQHRLRTKLLEQQVLLLDSSFGVRPSDSSDHLYLLTVLLTLWTNYWCALLTVARSSQLAISSGVQHCTACGVCSLQHIAMVLLAESFPSFLRKMHPVPTQKSQDVRA